MVEGRWKWSGKRLSGRWRWRSKAVFQGLVCLALANVLTLRVALTGDSAAGGTRESGVTVSRNHPRDGLCLRLLEAVGLGLITGVVCSSAQWRERLSKILPEKR